MQLTKDQQHAYDTCMSGVNVFLTGEAGTGKSFVTEKVIEGLKEQKKQVVVCAPTGIAAINVGGVTIHKLLQLNDGAYSIKSKKIRAKKAKLLKAADVVIVDEISMCRIDLFDCLVSSINKCNEERNVPIQLIVVGDFCQLPPVLKNDEAEVLSLVYKRQIKSCFAFESDNWQKCKFSNIRLAEVIRQSNPEFIENLNKARYADTSCISYFNSHTSKNETDGIYLSGRNKEVAEINNNRLSELPGTENIFNAIKKGQDISKDVLADTELKLKTGAKVMFLINDDEAGFRNGDFGTVKDIRTDEIDILFKGDLITLSRYTWAAYSYEITKEIQLVENPTTKEIKKKEVEVITKNQTGTFEQFPIKLAYAVTIHKSQGQTFDAVNLNPNCWDSGQLYCGLSRVRNIENLYLTEDIEPEWLKLDKKVKEFYKQFTKREYVSMLIPIELKDYLEQALADWEAKRYAQV